EVADHPDDAVLRQADVEGAVAPAADPAGPAEQLAEQQLEVDAPGRPHAEVPVRGQHPVVVVQRRRQADGHGLLADPGEPLAELPLAQELQHALLDEPGEDEGAVEPGGLGVGEVEGAAAGGDHGSTHWPRSTSTDFSTSVRSVMIPSTPMSSRRCISSGSSIVHTWTCSPRWWAAARKRSVTSGTGPRFVGTCTHAALKLPAGRPRDAATSRATWR